MTFMEMVANKVVENYKGKKKKASREERFPKSRRRAATHACPNCDVDMQKHVHRPKDGQKHTCRNCKKRVVPELTYHY